jgi:hypothetical protein
MRKVMDYFRAKWGITGIFRFWLIIFIFAVSGTTTLLIKEPVYNLFGIDESTPSWLRTGIYLIMIIPGYFMILMVYAAVFGEFRFFRDFIRKMADLFKPGRLSKKLF